MSRAEESRGGTGGKEEEARAAIRNAAQREERYAGQIVNGAHHIQVVYRVRWWCSESCSRGLGIMGCLDVEGDSEDDSEDGGQHKPSVCLCVASYFVCHIAFSPVAPYRLRHSVLLFSGSNVPSLPVSTKRTRKGGRKGPSVAVAVAGPIGGPFGAAGPWWVGVDRGPAIATLLARPSPSRRANDAVPQPSSKQICTSTARPITRLFPTALHRLGRFWDFSLPSLAFRSKTIPSTTTSSLCRGEEADRPTERTSASECTLSIDVAGVGKRCASNFGCVRLTVQLL